VADLAGHLDRGKRASRAGGRAECVVFVLLAGLAVVLVVFALGAVGLPRSSDAAPGAFGAASVWADFRRRRLVQVHFRVEFGSVGILLGINVFFIVPFIDGGVNQGVDILVEGRDVLEDTVSRAVEDKFPLLYYSHWSSGGWHRRAAVHVQHPGPVGRLAPEVDGEKGPVVKSCVRLVSRTRQ
jgi:hypothetical protein